MSPEQLEQIKERMRSRGMTEEQIEARLAGGGPPHGGPERRRPDFASMSPEQLERAKEFMRARGMTEQQIEARIRGEGRQPEPAGQ